MTRGFAMGAALLLGLLALAWWLVDGERDASGELHALTPPAVHDARVDRRPPARTPATRQFAQPTPLAALDDDVTPDPEPPLVGGPFALRVTDVAGRPVVDLPLRVDARAQQALPETTTRFARTDARGIAEFGPLPRGIELLWSCSDPAWFLARWPESDVDAPGQHAGKLSTDAGPVVDFVARRRGVALRGMLVDAAGEPLADVRVRAFERAAPTDAEPRRAWRSSGDTRTGVDGRFLFTLLAPGEHRVVAVEREAQHRVRVHHAVAQLAPDEARDLGELPRDALDPLQLVRVQPTLGGRPAAPAEVYAKPDELRFGVTLADDGDWPLVPLGELPGDGLDVTVQGLPRARWRPELRAELAPDDMLLPHAAPPMHMPLLEPRVAPGAPWVFEVPFSELVTLELRLHDETGGPPPRALQLGFLDEHGRTLLTTEAELPPPGAVLTAYTWPGPGWLVVGDARASGVFPGERYGVLAVHAFDARPPGPQLVDVVLHRPPVVLGTLLDADGDPVRGAALRFRLAGASVEREAERTLTAASTNDHGAFRAHGLPPDTEVELVLSYGGREHVHGFRTAAPGVTQQLEPIRLDVQEASALDHAWRAR